MKLINCEKRYYSGLADSRPKIGRERTANASYQIPDYNVPAEDTLDKLFELTESPD